MDSWLHVLEWRATVRPDQLALTDDRGDRATYAELQERVKRCAGGWHGADVAPGDVVAVVARNSVEFFVQVFGIMRCGAIPGLINWRLSTRELEMVLSRLKPVAVVTEPGFVWNLDAAAPGIAVRSLMGGNAGGWTPAASLTGAAPPRPEQLRSHSVMALVHTSGTTGKPKIIPLVHGSLIRAVSAAAIEIGDQVGGSKHLQLMPLFHLGGFGQAMQCLLTAGSLHILTTFEPKGTVDAIEGERIEFFTAAPSMVEMLVTEIRGRDQSPDLSSLREIQYGSAPITPGLLRDGLDTLGCRFRQIYGSTESQSMISLLAPEDHAPGHPHLASAGRVAFGWEVKVVDSTGRELPAGSPGELLIRGDSLFPGYWRDPEATAAVMAEDGFYHTGDIVSLTDDHYLYVLDRARDMIITGGENVYPAEVEGVLAGHPDVAEIAVIGLPHPRWGETVHAVVIPAGAPDERGLIKWSRERLAYFKCPRSVEYVHELPRTATGKVLKRELRAQRGAPTTTATGVPR